MSKPPLPTLLANCRKPDGAAIVQADTLSAEEAAQLAAAFNAARIHTCVIDGAVLTDKADLLRAVASSFRFPEHFGHNWDALIDTWSDLSWLPAAGYVCILLSAETFKANHPRIHETFLDVCTDVAERWQEYDPQVVFKLVWAARI